MVKFKFKSISKFSKRKKINLVANVSFQIYTHYTYAQELAVRIIRDSLFYFAACAFLFKQRIFCSNFDNSFLFGHFFNSHNKCPFHNHNAVKYQTSESNLFRFRQRSLKIEATIIFLVLSNQNLFSCSFSLWKCEKTGRPKVSAVVYFPIGPLQALLSTSFIAFNQFLVSSPHRYFRRFRPVISPRICSE